MNKKNLYAIPAMLAITTAIPFTPAIAQVQDNESNISVTDKQVDPQAALQWENNKTANPGDTVVFKRLSPATGLTTFPVRSSAGEVTVNFDAYGNAIVRVPETVRASEFSTTFEYEVNGEKHTQKLNLKINQPEPKPVTITPSDTDQELRLKPGESRTITPNKSLPQGMSWEFANGAKTTKVGELFTATINDDNTITIKAADRFPDGAKNELTGVFTAVANQPGYSRSTDLIKVTIYRNNADAKILSYPGEKGEIEIDPGQSITLTPETAFPDGSTLTIPSSLGGGWSVKDAGRGDGTIIVTAPEDVKAVKTVGFGVIVKDGETGLNSETYLRFITENPDYSNGVSPDSGKYDIQYDAKEKDVQPGGTVTFKNIGDTLPEGSNLSFMVPQGWDIKQGENGDIVVTSRSDKHIDGAWSTFNAVVTYPDGTSEVVPQDGMLRVNVKGEKDPGANLVDVSQPTVDSPDENDSTTDSDNTGNNTGNSNNNTDNTNENSDTDNQTGDPNTDGESNDNSTSTSSDKSEDDNADTDEKYFNRPDSRSKDDDSSSNSQGAKVISSNGSTNSNTDSDDQNSLKEYYKDINNNRPSFYEDDLAQPAANTAEGHYGPKVDTGGSVDNIWTKIINVFK